MRTKEEYYELIHKTVKLSGILSAQMYVPADVLRMAHAAVNALHWVQIPQGPCSCCFQPFINEKLKDLVKIGELTAVEKERTPAEYWAYVREQDKKLSKDQNKMKTVD